MRTEVSALLFMVLALLAFQPRQGISADSDRPWLNLVGLSGVSAEIPVNLAFSGAGALALDMPSFNSAVVKQLQRAKFLKNPGSNVPPLELLISGRTSDGQEGEYRISVKLLADVNSPFREDKTVVAVIWQTELSHSQALYYNNDTKKLERPNTKLADKLVADAQLLVERFIDDVQKANPPKR